MQLSLLKCFLDRVLVILPKICSVLNAKEELCSVLGGALDPESIIIAIVKESRVDLILVSEVSYP